MKKVRVTAAVKSGVLAVNWLSIFSATNESRRILDATLTPVIIFFAPPTRSLIHQSQELIHKLHLACHQLLLQRAPG